eukprot:4447851-Pyramimonas_sp.AAC.2
MPLDLLALELSTPLHVTRGQWISNIDAIYTWMRIPSPRWQPHPPVQQHAAEQADILLCAHSNIRKSRIACEVTSPHRGQST